MGPNEDTNRICTILYAAAAGEAVLWVAAALGLLIMVGALIRAARSCALCCRMSHRPTGQNTTPDAAAQHAQHAALHRGPDSEAAGTDDDGTN